MKKGKSDNQHFVPQFYLKGWYPFSAKSSDGMRCVRAWNISFGRIHGLVSIKHECSRSGFYGPKGNAVDGWLSNVENVLSDYFWQFRCASPRMPTQEEEPALRMFMSVQMLRTRYFENDMSELARRAAELFEDEQDKAFIEKELSTQDLDMSLQIPALAKEMLAATGDLSVLVVVNETGEEFITSDNPVVLANHAFPKHAHMGLTDIGLILMLPISPTRVVVLYDETAYVKKKVVYCRPNDVLAMNLIQACNARNNLYYRNEQLDLSGLVSKAARYRSKGKPYIARAVAEDPQDGDLLHIANRRANPRVRLSFCQPKPRFKRKYSKQIYSMSSVIDVPPRAAIKRHRAAEGQNSRPPTYSTYSPLTDGTQFQEWSRVELGTGARMPAAKGVKK